MLLTSLPVIIYGALDADFVACQYVVGVNVNVVLMSSHPFHQLRLLGNPHDVVELFYILC